MTPSIRDMALIDNPDRRVSVKTSLIIVSVELLVFIILELSGISIIDLL